jgi:hypothetical protein
MVDGVIPLATEPSQQPALNRDVVRKLRDGIATCRSPRGLSVEARAVISDVCRIARNSSWTPEQLLIAVKEACYSSPEISRLTTASDREAMLATIVTACINEFYTPHAD